MKRGFIIVALLFIVVVGVSFNTTPAVTKATLGEKLFFDPILSEDNTISCASCHKPEFAFADTVAFSVGVHGFLGKRNTPSIMNLSDRSAMFWDGRATTLEEQALIPMADSHEMNLPVAEAVKKLNANDQYRKLFMQVFKQLPDQYNVAAALAVFERTLETGNTPNDRWLNDEPNGMTAQQERGREIFRVKGKCLECHFSPDFTGDEFRSIGLFNGTTILDSGRYYVTKDIADIGKMKVPGLRNVAITAPYMHNGHFKTLREVIDYYDNPQSMMPNGINRDTVLNTPLGLTEMEKQDLEAFLHALTDDRFVKNK